jgi:hypothetical protein
MNHTIDDYSDEEEHKLVIDEDICDETPVKNYNTDKIVDKTISSANSESLPKNLTQSTSEIITSIDKRQLSNNENWSLPLNFCKPSTSTEKSTRSIECLNCHQFFETMKEIRSHSKVEHPGKAIRFVKQSPNPLEFSSKAFLIYKFEF